MTLPANAAPRAGDDPLADGALADGALADGALPEGVAPVRGPRLPFAPTRRLALVVLAAAPLWLLSGWGWGGAVAAGALALVAVAAAIDAALAPGPAALTLARRLPGVLGLGDAAPAAYVVRARWPRAVRVTVHDRLPRAVRRLPPGAPPPDAALDVAEPPDAARDARHRTAGDDAADDAADDEADDAPLPLVVPADGAPAVAPVTLVGEARGVHALGPVALRVAGPLGLVTRTVRWAGDERVTVAPSIAAVRRFRLLALQHRLRDAGVRQVRRRGGGSTFAALREYAPGDDPRRIDWKATARRQATLVREYTAEQGQTVLVAVDAGRLMTQLVAPRRSRLDAALDAAMVLADVAAQGGDRVGVLVFDDRVRAFVPPTAGAAAVGRIRDALVGVQPSLVESDYATAFRTLAERHRRRSLVVLFTDVIDARASRALLAHVARGAVRHLPLVVALRDDALDAAARPAGAPAAPSPAGDAPAPVLGVYATAAAEELLLAREDALARMRRSGVAVLDVSARAMTAAVVNQYLAIKARGAL